MKKKIVNKEIQKEPVEVIVNVPEIQMINETFGNGDMNILRDKINEIISIINK